MAEELLRVLKCDIDGSSEDVVTFYIKHDGQEWKVDLCGEHAKPIFDAIHAGKTTTAGTKVRPSTAAALDRRFRE